MKIMTVKNADEGGQVVLNLLRQQIDKGAKNLGLATGSTPLTFYRKLVESELDLSELTSLNLDEYVGLSADNPQSYAYFMQEHLFKTKPFKTSFLPNGMAKNLQAEVDRYDALIAKYPIDFQILGIGRNGHIGFNEPGTAFDTRTHVVDLTSSTIEANSRFFADLTDVPKQAISMGIASIMQSKTIVLMAYGIEKADAIAGMVNGPVIEDLPASILQKHPDVIVIVDEAAASKLN